MLWMKCACFYGTMEEVSQCQGGGVSKLAIRTTVAWVDNDTSSTPHGSLFTMADRMLSLAKLSLICLGGLLIMCFGVDFYQKTQWPWLEQEVDYGPKDGRSASSPEQQYPSALTNSVVGIYIGETHSQVGIVRNQAFEMIIDAQNRSLVPSYVAFLDGAAPLVGFAAREHADRNPQSTVYGVR